MKRSSLDSLSVAGCRITCDSPAGSCIEEGGRSEWLAGVLCYMLPDVTNQLNKGPDDDDKSGSQI